MHLLLYLWFTRKTLKSNGGKIGTTVIEQQFFKKRYFCLPPESSMFLLVFLKFILFSCSGVSLFCNAADPLMPVDIKENSLKGN